MREKTRNIGMEILEGLREIRRGEVARVINVPGVAQHVSPMLKRGEDMQSTNKQTQAVTPRVSRTRNAQAVKIAANSYCLRNYAVGYTGGTPRRLSLRGNDLWIVPVIFTSPGYGAVGEVGLLALDAISLEVAGATPRAEVKAAGARLAREKHEDLDAAFHRARKS
jgi:hypothetical protein